MYVKMVIFYKKYHKLIIDVKFLKIFLHSFGTQLISEKIE